MSKRKEVVSSDSSKVQELARLPPDVLQQIFSKMEPSDQKEFALHSPLFQNHTKEVTKKYKNVNIHMLKKYKHSFLRIMIQLWNFDQPNIEIRMFIVGNDDDEAFREDWSTDLNANNTAFTCTYCINEVEMENLASTYIDTLLSNAIIGRLDITKTSDFLTLPTTRSKSNLNVRSLVLHDCEYVDQNQLLELIEYISPGSLTLIDRYYERGSYKSYFMNRKTFRPDDSFFKNNKIISLDEFVMGDIGSDAKLASLAFLSSKIIEFNPSPLPPAHTQILFCKYIQEWRSGRRSISHISFYARLLTHYYDSEAVKNILGNCEFHLTNHGENAALLQRRVNGKTEYIAIQVGSWLHAECLTRILTKVELKEL